MSNPASGNAPQPAPRNAIFPRPKASGQKPRKKNTNTKAPPPVVASRPSTTLTPEELIAQRREAMTPAEKAARDLPLNVTHHPVILKGATDRHTRLRKHWNNCRTTQQPGAPPVDKSAERPPNEPEMKVFGNYLADVIVGIVDKINHRPTIASLKGEIAAFATTWYRATDMKIPRETMDQVQRYLSSPEFQAQNTTTDEKREDHYISWQDTDTLLMTRSMHAAEIHQLSRSGVQWDAITKFCRLSGSRIGEIIVSSAHGGTNEALCWGDIEWFRCQNDADPLHPIIIALIKLKFLKGNRYDPAVFKYMTFVLQSNDNTRACPVRDLLQLAFQDGIFTDIKEARQLLETKAAVTGCVPVRVRRECAKLPVFRPEVHKDGAWVTDPENALPYDAYRLPWNKTVKLSGITLPLVIKDMRCASSNDIMREGSELDRMQAQAHENKDIFLRGYLLHVPNVDHMAIAQERFDDGQKGKLSRKTASASATRVPGLPVALEPLVRRRVRDEDSEYTERSLKLKKLNNQLTAPTLSSEDARELKEAARIARNELGMRDRAIQGAALRRVREEYVDEARAAYEKDLQGSPPDTTSAPADPAGTDENAAALMDVDDDVEASSRTQLNPYSAALWGSGIPPPAYRALACNTYP